MISLEEAWNHVLSRVAVLGTESVPLAEALGLVVAEPVRTEEAVPPFDNSAVDGFAVRSSDASRPGARLRVVATVAAGSAGDVRLGPGEAARIMTGAPIPAGADAVVMVEDSVMVEDGMVEDGVMAGQINSGDQIGGQVVELAVPAEPGRNIRPAGDDLSAGDLVVQEGAELTEAHLGLLATVGRCEVTVIRRPRVGVMSTGDELVEGPAPLRRGQIRDSNRLTLLACCRAAGFDTVDLGLVADDESAIEATLRDGADRCDAVLSSGGVSMGEYDFVKAVLDRIGDMRWMQVAIKPAKPFAFGTVEGTPVFGLPGNPVSSQVSFELFARPGIRHMGGHGENLFRRRVRAVATEGLARRSDGKVHFVRVKVDQDADLGFRVRSAGAQGSHQLSAMASADGLAVLADGDGVAPGDAVTVMLLR